MRKLWLIMAILSLIACSKYDENPAISLTPKKMRLSGIWKPITSVDSSGTETELPEAAQETGELEFKWKGIGTQGGADFNWYFSSDKKRLVFQYESDPSTFVDQSILKLTMKELWLGSKDVGYTIYEKL